MYNPSHTQTATATKEYTGMDAKVKVNNLIYKSQFHRPRQCQRCTKTITFMILSIVVVIKWPTQHSRLGWNLIEPLTQYQRHLSKVSKVQNDIKVTKDIYYIKVHKTGSTTMQNILHRFAIKHDLKVALYNNEWANVFPDAANASYLFEDITNMDTYKKYNIMCDHAVFDEAVFSGYMRPKLTYIATLREPLSQLISAFDFWRMAKRFGLLKSKDPLTKFLEQGPESFRDPKDFIHQRVKNIQAHSLGYTNIDNNDLTEAQEYISYLDSKIDHVILSEQYDEGLVYLKEHLNWNLSDILYIKHYKSSESQKVRTESSIQRLRQLHRNLSTIDYAIYDHFKQKTSDILKRQPPSYWDQVEYFKTVLKHVQSFCKTICEHIPSGFLEKNIDKRREILRILLENHTSVEASRWNEKFHITFGDCELMRLSTVDFSKALRVHQFPKVCDEHVNNSHIRKAKWKKLAVKHTYWCRSQDFCVFTLPYDYITQDLKTICK